MCDGRDHSDGLCGQKLRGVGPVRMCGRTFVVMMVVVVPRVVREVVAVIALVTEGRVEKLLRSTRVRRKEPAQ